LKFFLFFTLESEKFFSFFGGNPKKNITPVRLIKVDSVVPTVLKYDVVKNGIKHHTVSFGNFVQYDILTSSGRYFFYLLCFRFFSHPNTFFITNGLFQVFELFNTLAQSIPFFLPFTWFGPPCET